MRHAVDLKNGGSRATRKLRLLYSTKTLDEIIFDREVSERNETKRIASILPVLDCGHESE